MLPTYTIIVCPPPNNGAKKKVENTYLFDFQFFKKYLLDLNHPSYLEFPRLLALH